MQTYIPQKRSLIGIIMINLQIINKTMFHVKHRGVYMDLLIDCTKAFLVGGFICMLGQILIDYTKLTPARILTTYVVCGVLFTAIGLYEPIVKFAGAGATIPLTGFGYSLANGVKTAVGEYGIIGALSGGLTATASGIAAAMFFGLIMSLVFKSGDK